MNTTANSPQDSFDWKQDTVTQRALLKKELAPPEFLVQGLLVTPGLIVLAGKKKIGKSWMVLQLAQCVASGTPFLDKETKQGNVVYFALEDGERRLKYRLERQRATPKLPIRYCPSWPPLSGIEGFKALVSILREKTPALVVIDTLAAAFDQNVKENEADSIGKLFNLLHKLAIKSNTVILIVAHHGKKSYGDVGFDIRGSSAIPSATDANIGLYKNTDGTFTLGAEGRDILDMELRIKFDSEITWTWHCLGDDRDIRRVEAETEILEAIDALGGEADATDIAKKVEIARPTVYKHLKRMRTEKRVEHEEVKKATGVKIFYRLLQSIRSTSPTRLPCKGSRQVGKVGTETEDINEEPITDEEVREWMRELREVPDRTDVSKIIASHL